MPKLTKSCRAKEEEDVSSILTAFAHFPLGMHKVM
jgi:hypothetical protein